MSQARVFSVENTLQKINNAPGGRTIGEALQTATMRISAVRGPTLAALHAKVERMAQVAAAGKAAGRHDALHEVYEAANAIYGLAATFELAALAEACFSLCDVVEAAQEGDAHVWPAVDVHIDGIRLLTSLHDKADVAGAGLILEGLKKVRARLVAGAQAKA